MARTHFSPIGREYGVIMDHVRLDHPTLRQAIEKLGEQSHAKIRVDWEALKTAGFHDLENPMDLDLDLHHVSLDQILPFVVDGVGGGGVVMGTTAQQVQIGAAAVNGEVLISAEGNALPKRRQSMPCLARSMTFAIC